MNVFFFFLDEIKISSKSSAEHVASVGKFCEICGINNVHLNKDKCESLPEKRNYLGFVVDKFGINKTTEKIGTIQKCPQPENINNFKIFW